jgi:hypothetical protein
MHIQYHTENTTDPPASALAITLDREPPDLRSTRNSFEDSSAPRRGLAGDAPEQLPVVAVVKPVPRSVMPS